MTTVIKCADGETVVLTHDCSLPRPYSRGYRVQGTKGIYMEDGGVIYLEGQTVDDPNHWTHSWNDAAPYIDKYEHPLWKNIRSTAFTQAATAAWITLCSVPLPRA